MIRFNRLNMLKLKLDKSRIHINNESNKHFFSTQPNQFQKELGLKNRKTVFGKIRRFERKYPNLNWYLRYLLIFGILSFSTWFSLPGCNFPGQYKLKLNVFRIKNNIFKYWSTELYNQPQNYINQFFEDLLHLFKQQIFDLNYICQFFQTLEFYSQEADKRRSHMKKLKVQYDQMKKQGKNTKTSTIKMSLPQRNQEFNVILIKNKKQHEARLKRQKQQKYALDNIDRYEVQLKKEQHFFDKTSFRNMILMYATIILEKIIKYQVDLLLQPKLYQKYWFVFSKVFSTNQSSQQLNNNYQKKDEDSIFMEIKNFHNSCYPIIDYLIKYRINIKNQNEILTKILQKVANQMKVNQQFCKKSFDNEYFIKTLKNQYQSKQNNELTKQLILNIFQEMDKVYKKFEQKSKQKSKISKVNQKSLDTQFKRISKLSQKKVK